MKNKRILFIANIDRFHKVFHQPLFKELHKLGWIIDVASNGEKEFDNIRHKYNVNIQRSPLSFKNLKAIRQLRKIIDKNEYDIIHSHTPMGGVVARIANKNKSTKNVYTAHGFHFYKGAPLINWLLYYPVEKLLSRKTDLIFTINKEDYNRALKNFKKPLIKHINGVGINFDKFNLNGYKDCIRKELGIKENDFVITSVGELNNNKNQMFALRNLKDIVKKNTNIKYLIVGKGSNKDKYQKYIDKHNLNNNIYMLGYRNDVPNILKKTNLLISPSKREGQGINVIEAMRMNVLTLVSEIRGHTDIVKNGETGFLFNLNNPNTFKKKINEISKEKVDDITKKAFEETSKFRVDKINEIIIQQYEKLLGV